MTEVWDLYNEHHELTGRSLAKGEEIPKGYYHLIVHVWIKNKKGEYLISQRSKYCKTNQLKWECVGGSVIKGENSLAGAIRETKEEVGLDLSPKSGKLVSTITKKVANCVRSSTIVDVWLFEYDGQVDLKNATTNECTQCMWANKQQIKELFGKGLFVDTREYFFKLDCL